MNAVRVGEGLSPGENDDFHNELSESEDLYGSGRDGYALMQGDDDASLNESEDEQDGLYQSITEQPQSSCFLKSSISGDDQPREDERSSHMVVGEESLFPMNVSFAQLSGLVDRALKRMEDDYERTINAKWTDMGDERIDRCLDLMELRISKLEDLHDDFEELQQLHNETTVLRSTTEGTNSSKRSVVRTDDVKQHASQFKLAPPPDFGEDWVRRALTKLNVSDDSSTGGLLHQLVGGNHA